MTLTIEALGRMTPDELRRLEAELATDEGQQQAYAVAQELWREWGGDDGRLPNTGGRVVGFGARGAHVRAVQLVTRAAALRDGVDDARDNLTVDGVFGNDTLAAVRLGQSALGEREDNVAGKYYALSHISTLAGLQQPEGQSYRDRRRAVREAMRTNPEQFARAAPLPGEAAAPGAAPRGPAEITDAPSANAALSAAWALDGDARRNELRRIGDAARANPAVAEGVGAGLILPETSADRLLDYLRANDGQDNEAVLRTVRASDQWGVLRGTVAAQSFDARGLSSRTLDLLAGEPPAADAPQAVRDTWQALRLRAVRAKAAEGTTLDRRDFDNLLASPNRADLTLLTRGPQDDAVAATRAAINRLPPAPAAQLLRDIHGELPANPALVSPDMQSRWAITHQVLGGVFGQGLGSDERRFNFFNAVAAEPNPMFWTMEDGLYQSVSDQIWRTGTDWGWWYGGDRSVGAAIDQLNAARATRAGYRTPVRQTVVPKSPS